MFAQKNKTTWYAPPGLNLNNFEKWLEPEFLQVPKLLGASFDVEKKQWYILPCG
jgi:hypothetical protein